MNARRAAFLFIGGIVAGAFDIVYAMLFSWVRSSVTPMRVLQAVASGLLGRSAYGGGVATASLGLFLHFLIALIWAGIYFAAATRFKTLATHPVLCGLLYGAFIYAAMHVVVVPASRFAGALLVTPTGLLVHMLLIGLPIALAARAAEGRRAVESGAGS